MKKSSLHWIQHTHIFRKDEYECSACSYYADKPYVTCPNCGAPMNGTKYESSWVDEIEAIDAIFDDQ